MSEHIIDLINITKSYGDNEIIKDMSLYIRKNEFLTLLGPSGCGKTTTLRLIAGFEKPDSGKILFNGQDIANLPPNKRNVNTVFQKYSLFPNMNIYENIAFGLKIKKLNADAIRDKVTWALDLVSLQGFEKRTPDSLSGGQQQRIAIARALATNPKVLLCDEATSALDPNTTSSILELLKEINRSMGVTIIVITHEMKVIEQICNKVAVIDNSRIVEEGPVTEVFTAPKSQIAKQLILPTNQGVPEAEGFRCLRLVFDGTSAFEPIISGLSRSCDTDVNILGANTRNIDGVAYGQMLIQLPEDEAVTARIKEYLDQKNVKYKEEGLNVG